MATFDRPANQIAAQDNFQDREVGITHPDLPSFIKLLDNGDIEIVAADNCLIILSAANSSITLIADQIKLLTSDSNGIRINNTVLNSNAISYEQPALVPLQLDESANMYKHASIYTKGL